MADEGIVACVFARLLPERRTPIAVTTVIAVVLISTGDLSTLADTTVVRLPSVFTIVTVAVLVRRRDRVEHDHFRGPVGVSLGAIVAVALIVDTALARAAILLAVGVALWLVNSWLSGPPEQVEIEQLRG